MNRRRGAVAWLALGLAAAPVPGRAAPALDIRLERDPRPGALSSALAVNLKVTVTEGGTGAAPGDSFDVYAFAEPPNGNGGAATETFPCAQEHDNSPEVPRGVYLCTVLVDHGGAWRFHSVVNRLRLNTTDQPVTLGRAAQDFAIDTAEVAPRLDANRIKGRFVEVALLWGHTAAAGVWLVAAAVVAALALPALRRRLSTHGIHRLEDRFDVVAKAVWTSTAVLVGSGAYLLVNQTAYDTPFSSTSLDAVSRLPYGKPYFLALGIKLAVYSVMLAATFALLRQARRQLRLGDDVAIPAAVRLGAAALVGGTVALSLSITLLKYFHELIEAARTLL